MTLSQSYDSLYSSTDSTNDAFCQLMEKLPFSDEETGQGKVQIPHDCSDVSVDRQRRSRETVRNEKGLVCDLQLMLTLPDMCDVKFLVGPDYIPVYGIRVILAARSRAFGQLILAGIRLRSYAIKKNKPLKEKLMSFKKKIVSNFKSRNSCKRKARRQTHMVIRVEEFDPDTFRRVILYLHTGRVNLTVQSVVGVMNAADKYGLVNLKDSCFQFASTIINVDTTCSSTTER